jgi:hypothetical protein
MATFPPLLTDYIRVYDTQFPDNFLEELLAALGEDPFERACVNAPDPGYQMINMNRRSCSVCYISFMKNRPNIERFDEMISKETARILSLYHDEFPFMVCNRDTGYDFLKYEVGEFHREHIDQYQDIPNRFLGISYILNDDYEGGDLSFFGNTYTPTVKKNQVVIFPSNFMYPHQVTPVTKGTRYAIITWIF